MTIATRSLEQTTGRSAESYYWCTPGRSLDIAEAGAVLRHGAGQGRGHLVGGDDIGAGDVLDPLELVFTGHVTHGDDLDGLIGAAGDVDEHRAEIVHALGAFDLGAQAFPRLRRSDPDRWCRR